MKDMLSLGLRHTDNHLILLDQTKLPHVEDWLECRGPQEMVGMIRRHLSFFSSQILMASPMR